MSDGTREQASLDRYNLPGRLPEYSLFGVFVECVVVAARQPDDPNNVTGFLEYDCDPISYGFGRIVNCIRLETASGMDESDESTLRVAERTVTGLVFDKDGSTPRHTGDGDRVIVTFLDGSKARPIIVGCYPHPFNETARKAAGTSRVRSIKHKGAEVMIDTDGNVYVKSAKTIYLGTGTNEPVALGDAVRQELDDLWSALTKHQHDVKGVTPGGGTVVATSAGATGATPSESTKDALVALRAPVTQDVTSSKVRVAR